MSDIEAQGALQTHQGNYFVHTLHRARDWQHRPQIDEVCQWWRDGGMGVCALVGMGGAGKTVIAERFLNDFLDDTSAPRPALFVYSFYDDDKPENFFRHLQIWLEGTSAPDKQKSPTQLMFDIQQHQGLIILDGLEKVQESVTRGGFGRLTSPSLRDLLNHIACGSARGVSALVTSRFPLTDLLHDSLPRFFQAIEVDQIEVSAGIALLRSRGVRGTDVQLTPIVEHCGRHALTIDLAGGYIKEYGHGDPSTPLNLGTAEELQAEAEQEPDDDKRAVLKQGLRFARIAQRYREAMLASDEAVLALLERICLFRLGVDCETLAAIFTGPDAEKVSGKALASLDAHQLQRKLDWLVHMRILERSQLLTALRAQGSKPKTLYTIHPAVRDGFLRGISRDDARTCHQAVRHGLEVSLDSSDTNPSEPATLDLLEEIVYHTIQCGRPGEAWRIYWHRMGNSRNLLWRLGAYERGERICRAFAGGRSPESIRTMICDQGRVRVGSTTNELPYDSLSKDEQPYFINEWALYLSAHGHLIAASYCYDICAELAVQQENWAHASVYLQNLGEVRMQMGRLNDFGRASESLNRAAHRSVQPRARELRFSQSARRISDEALRHAQRGRFGYGHMQSHAIRAHVLALLGEISAALSDFIEARNWQHKLEWYAPNRPLWGNRGYWRTQLLARLGRHEEARRLASANIDVQFEELGSEAFQVPQCRLLLASLEVEQSELPSAESLLAWSRSWAEDRDEKEVLCWSDLVEIQMMLSANSGQQCSPGSKGADGFSLAEQAVTRGLKIARDCGFGLYHIDLLLERARLHLLRGDAGAALEDIEVALDTGVPANEETGQVELLAANHEECGYAWAIPAGRELRTEALLLKAANEAISVGIALRTVDGSLARIDVDAVRTAHPTIGQLIDEAEQLLNEALDRWHDLRDPEPTEDNNFVHPETGKEYNYKAEETYRLLADLESGILTRYPFGLASSDGGEDSHEGEQVNMESDAQLKSRVLESESLLELSDQDLARLKALTRRPKLSDYHAQNARGQSVPAIEAYNRLQETIRFNAELRTMRTSGLRDESMRVAESQTSDKDVVMPTDRQTPPIDFLIITPLAEERDAVLTRLEGHRRLPPTNEDIRAYYIATVSVTFADETAGEYAVVVMPLAKMGHTEAASATGDAIRRWDPRYVVLVGIAGGMKNQGVKLGDVLIANQVADYELGKVTRDGDERRWEVHRVDQRLLVASQNYCSADWHQTEARRYNKQSPRTHYGPICTGNKVIADESMAAQLQDVWQKLIGVEMEASGVANAAAQSVGKPGFFMVRGVSDLADGDKSSSHVKRWRRYACEIAAAWCIEFLKSGPVPTAIASRPR